MPSNPSNDGGSLRRRWLLFALVAIWAVSWPAVKVGVTTVPPLGYACLRYAIAALCLFALAAARRRLALPPRADWPLVAVSGALQMATYSALTGLALTVLPPGRASVLAYSTPLWVVPLSARWLGERGSLQSRVGVTLGLLGVLAIAAPSIRLHEVRAVAAYAMLLGAALAWAVSIVFVRAHRFTASPLALAPWQMLVAAALLAVPALALEHTPRGLGVTAVASLAYVGPVATGFAYWAVVEVGRHFRASTLSMALLATPGIGILISAIALGEPVGPSLIAGVALTSTGIRLATSARS
jgi:drug/metabolite transporter (DMT)-like permease